MALENRQHLSGEWNRTTATRLGIREVWLSAWDQHQRSAYSERRSLEITPLQAERLTRTDAGEKKQRERGVLLSLVGLNPQVLTMVRRSPLGRTLEQERMHINLEVAVAKYLKSLQTN